MATFSLIEQCWIPVRPLGGGAVKEVGLRELLLHADQFGRIDDPSPLVTVALYRLALAVLHRALSGPYDPAQAADWYKNGFPAEKLEDYFRRHQDRFDLFHPELPFMQDWRLPSESADYHWSLMTSEDGSYNSNFLYGLKNRVESVFPANAHQLVREKVLGHIQPSQAVRQLLQHLTFSLGGRTTGATDPQSDSPAASAALVLAEGDHLQQTLSLNLLPYDTDAIQKDIPPWEWERTELESRAKGKQVIAGFASRYTWLSRGVRLNPSESGEITWLAYGGGINPVTEAKGQYLEPMAAYRSGKDEALRPLRLEPSRLFWRDFTALLPSGDREPMTLWNARNILRAVKPPSTNASGTSRRERLKSANRDYQRAIQVSVYGISRKQQKINLYRQENFSLSEQFVEDTQTYTNVVNVALQDAEAGAVALRRALRLMCWLMVTTEADRQKEGTDPARLKALSEYLANLPDHEDETAYKGKEVPKKVARLYRQLPGEDFYWSSLDPLFRALISGPVDDQTLTNWNRELVHVARSSWNLALTALGDDEAALRADAQAERLFNRLLAPIRKKAKGEENTNDREQTT